MEMRHGMPVWAPTEVDMREIRRRVSRERAAVAADLFRRAKALFAGEDRDPQSASGTLQVGCGSQR